MSACQCAAIADGQFVLGIWSLYESWKKGRELYALLETMRLGQVELSRRTQKTSFEDPRDDLLAQSQPLRRMYCCPTSKSKPPIDESSGEFQLCLTWLYFERNPTNRHCIQPIKGQIAASIHRHRPLIILHP
jgi:hypothetical protein